MQNNEVTGSYLYSKIDVSKIVFRVKEFKIQDIQKIAIRIKPSNFKTYLLCTHSIFYVYLKNERKNNRLPFKIYLDGRYQNVQ